MPDPNPSAGPPRSRRRWVRAAVTVWTVAVLGLGWWSVRHDPPTVAEQRTIGQTVPALQQAVGVVVAVAQGPGRVLEIGALSVAPGCPITPVRSGATATQEVTVNVRAEAAGDELDRIAAALPESYRARVTTGHSASRIALHADAGSFIGIDGVTDVGAEQFVLRVSSGCRPDDPPRWAEPANGRPPPAVLVSLLDALGRSASVNASAPVSSGSDGDAVLAGAEVRAVPCPGGGATAATFAIGGITAPPDITARLRRASAGTDVVRADPGLWAYRAGNDSVVVAAQGDRVRVSVTTPCAAP